MSRILPSWDEIEQFRQPLTDGEEALAKYLDDHLPPEWQIFVQPHLNGDKPDLAVLNPKVGLVFFEVKDWNPDLYFARDEWRTSADGRKWKARQFYVNHSTGTQPIPSPVSQVGRYRDNLFGIYLPSIGEAVDKNTKALAPFKIALYFHHMTTERARDLVATDPKRCAVLGYDSLEPERLVEIVADSERERSSYMRDDWADKIRFFLNPPFHTIEQGTPLKLSPEQRRHAEPDPGKHQRLRGVAGSGLTISVALGFCTVLLTPFAEEAFFRGFLFTWMTGHRPVWLAMLVSSLIFGAMHIVPPQAISAGLMALALCALYWYSGSLWPPFVAHVIGNGIGYFGMLVSTT